MNDSVLPIAAGCGCLVLAVFATVGQFMWHRYRRDRTHFGAGHHRCFNSSEHIGEPSLACCSGGLLLGVALAFWVFYNKFPNALGSFSLTVMVVFLSVLTFPCLFWSILYLIAARLPPCRPGSRTETLPSASHHTPYEFGTLLCVVIASLGGAVGTALGLLTVLGQFSVGDDATISTPSLMSTMSIAYAALSVLSVLLLWALLAATWNYCCQASQARLQESAMTFDQKMDHMTETPFPLMSDAVVRRFAHCFRIQNLKRGDVVKSEGSVYVMSGELSVIGPRPRAVGLGEGGRKDKQPREMVHLATHGKGRTFAVFVSVPGTGGFKEMHALEREDAVWMRRWKTTAHPKLKKFKLTPYLQMVDPVKVRVRSAEARILLLDREAVQSFLRNTRALGDVRPRGSGLCCWNAREARTVDGYIRKMLALDILGVLEGHPFFSLIESRKHPLLASLFYFQVVLSDKVLVKEGEKMDHLFIVVSGTLVVEKTMTDAIADDLAKHYDATHVDPTNPHYHDHTEHGGDGTHADNDNHGVSLGGAGRPKLGGGGGGPALAALPSHGDGDGGALSGVLEPYVDPATEKELAQKQTSEEAAKARALLLEQVLAGHAANPPGYAIDKGCVRCACPGYRKNMYKAGYCVCQHPVEVHLDGPTPGGQLSPRKSTKQSLRPVRRWKLPQARLEADDIVSRDGTMYKGRGSLSETNETKERQGRTQSEERQGEHCIDVQGITQAIEQAGYADAEAAKGLARADAARLQDAALDPWSHRRALPPQTYQQLVPKRPARRHDPTNYLCPVCMPSCHEDGFKAERHEGKGDAFLGVVPSDQVGMRFMTGRMEASKKRRCHVCGDACHIRLPKTAVVLPHGGHGGHGGPVRLPPLLGQSHGAPLDREQTWTGQPEPTVLIDPDTGREKLRYPLMWWQREKVNVALLHPGAFFGEQGVVGDRVVHHNAAIKTKNRCLLLCLKRRHFTKLISLVPGLKKTLGKHLEGQGHDGSFYRNPHMEHLKLFSEENLRVLLGRDLDFGL